MARFFTAWLGGFPRKRPFVATLTFFAISNLLAAVAPNIGVMAFARFVPALILPVFWSLASETAVKITGPENAGRAVSLVSFGVVAATIFGIPTGTLISDAFGRRSAFCALSVLAMSKALLRIVSIDDQNENIATSSAVFEKGGRDRQRMSRSRGLNPERRERLSGPQR